MTFNIILPCVHYREDINDRLFHGRPCLSTSDIEGSDVLKKFCTRVQPSAPVRLLELLRKHECTKAIS